MMVKHISQKLGIQIHYSEISYFLYVYRRGGSAMTSREPDQQEGFGLYPGRPHLFVHQAKWVVPFTIDFYVSFRLQYPN